MLDNSLPTEPCSDYTPHKIAKEVAAGSRWILRNVKRST